MHATVTPGYVRMMAEYNAEMNRRLYDAAARLTDLERRADRGAFWGSIHGTLSHLVWADQQWMSRFDGWDKPPVALRQSPGMMLDFGPMWTRRQAMDADLLAWAARVGADWLDGDLTWMSGAARRELTKPVGLLVTHMFNHQTHHRGQVHAMLTAAGQQTEDTDLMLIV